MELGGNAEWSSGITPFVVGSSESDAGRERLQDLELLATLANALMADTPSDVLLRSFSRQAGGIFGCNEAVVYLVSQDGAYLELDSATWHLPLPFAVDAALKKRLVRPRVLLKPGGFYRSVLEGGDPVITNDESVFEQMALEFEGAEALRSLIRPLLRTLGVRTTMSVPIRSGDKSIGLIDISRADPPFSQRDTERMAGFSRQLAIFLQRRAEQEALGEREREFATLVRSVSDAVFVLDTDGRLMRAWGHWPDGLPDALSCEGMLLERFMPPTAAEAHHAAVMEAVDHGIGVCEWTIEARNGERHRYETVISRERAEDAAAPRLVCVARDITAHHLQQESLELAAVIDPLTGVLNRRGLDALADSAIALARRQGLTIAVVFLDVDGLKAINDQHGHQIGDRALKEVASCMRRTFRASDVIGRTGGDEFVVIACDASEQQLSSILGRLKQQLTELNQQPDRVFQLSVSAGTAFSPPGDTRSLGELMTLADLQMYAAKSLKRR
jgi:diguanylate cyclase (GGDEF)-like protein